MRATWRSVTASYIVTAPGHHSLAYRAVDRAGHLSAVGTAVFAIGEVKPIYLPFILKLSA